MNRTLFSIVFLLIFSTVVFPRQSFAQISSETFTDKEGKEHDSGIDREVKDLPSGKTFQEFMAGALKGDAQNQFEVGRCYRNGLRGAPKNLEEALKWYRKSAEQGNSNGENNVGLCYWHGEGGERE